MPNNFVARNFLIVGTQRTGSSALGEAVGLHPQIACGWEWTLRTPPWAKLEAAEQALAGDFSRLREKARAHILREWTPGKTVLGFRRLFRSSSKWVVHPRLSPALGIDRFEAHLRWLAGRPDIRIVHIVRRNNLGWLRSKVLSEATGRYVGMAYPADLQLTMALRPAIRSLRAKAWVDQRLARLQGSNAYLQIAYEDFSADNLAWARKVVSFLGCDPDALPARELRIKPQSRSDGPSQIRNWDNLKERLTRLGLLEAQPLPNSLTGNRAGG